MNGEDQVESLRTAGFSSDEIAQHVTDTHQKLVDAGFSQAEADAYFGKKELNMAGAEKHFVAVRADLEKPNASGERQAVTFQDYLEAGWQTSVAGLDVRRKLPDVVMGPDAHWYDRVTASVAQLAGDLPPMVVGAIGGGAAGSVIPGVGTAIGAGAGGFALPAALRANLIQNIKRGAVKDSRDFLDRAAGVAIEGMKGAAIGGATAGAGVVAKTGFAAASPVLRTGAQVTSELTAMVSVQKAFEGELPQPEDFTDAAVVLAGLKGVTHVTGKLQDIYARTGKTPGAVLTDIESDPTIKNDILSSNKEVPDAYRPLDEPPTFKAKAQSAYEKFYTDYVNDLNPIFNISRKLANGEKVPVIEDPAKLAQLTRGSFGRADHFVEYSPFKFDTYKNVGKSLKDSLAPVFDLEDAVPSEAERAVLSKLDTGELAKADNVGGVDRLEAYMLAKHVVEAKTETGVSLDAARQTVKEGSKQFDSVARDVTAFREHTLQYMVDGGLVSTDKASAFREAYKSYIPLYRLFDGEVGGRINGKSDLRSPILGRQGSERQIQHPLDSIIKDTYTFIALTERNAARLALADLAEKSPVGADYVKKVPTPSKPITVTEPEVAAFLKAHGLDPSKAEAFSIFRPDYGLKDDQIAVFRDGKREIYQVDPEVKKAFEGADRPTANLLVDLLSKPASWLRAGAVLSPDFIGRNPVRDQWSAFIFSGAGYRPFMDMAAGLGSVFKKDENYQAWLKSGGANSALVSVDREYIENKVLHLAKETGLLDSAINVIKTPIEALRVTSELMENATRVGEFKRTAGSESGKAAMLEGGFNSREGTLDFARIGAKMHAVNRIVAFSNAGIQGIDRAVRAFKENPVGTSAKIAASITLPSVLLWWANHDDPRYKDIPQWQKDVFWIVMTKDHVYRWPKNFELGILFGTVPERLLDKYVGENPHAFDHLASTVTQAFVPNYMPTATVPFFEQWANKSFLTGNPVVPAQLEKLLPEYQYAEYTTEATKAIGHAIGTLPGLHDSDAASPAIIENYIRGWSGGLGQYVLKTADFGLRKMGALPDPVKPADTLADVPFVKAFVVRYPSGNAQPITDFYDRYGANKRVADTVQALAKEGNADAMMREMQLQPGALAKLDDISASLSEASKTVRLIYKMPDLSPDEKRQLIDTIYYQMIEMAKAGNSAMDEVEKVLPRQ